MSAARILHWALVAVVLAGCHGADLGPPQVPGATPNGATATRAGQQPLIYTSDDYVYVYTYSGQQVQELQGFGQAAGLCSDTSGNVYVTDAAYGLIYEYARGGSLPINVLDDSGQSPNSCAVDPSTGDLAVTNMGPIGGGNGNVLIYPPGSGQTGVPYSTPTITRYAFCGYDNAGNLYVDGQTTYHNLRLAELQRGATNLTDVTLAGLASGKHNAGGVQWDGQLLAVADGTVNSIYRISVSGSTGTIVDSIRLAKWHHQHFPPEFSILGKRLVFPFEGASAHIAFFGYPAGGQPKGGFFGDVGPYITVSAPK